jgi:hypothetical protein
MRTSAHCFSYVCVGVGNFVNVCFKVSGWKYLKAVRVFENGVLRRIFGPKRDEVTGEWRNLHNEELHNLYSYPDIIRQVKSRRMR